MKRLLALAAPLVALLVSGPALAQTDAPRSAFFTTDEMRSIAIEVEKTLPQSARNGGDRLDSFYVFSDTAWKVRLCGVTFTPDAPEKNKLRILQVAPSFVRIAVRDENDQESEQTLRLNDTLRCPR